LRELEGDVSRLAERGSVASGPRCGAAPVLSCRGVRASFDADRQVLAGVDLELRAAESVAITGPSGSGKTTLLQAIAGLIPVDAGEMSVAGAPLGGASEAVRARTRLQHIGMVFQFGELLPELSVRENIELPLRLRGERGGTIAAELADDLGLRGLLDAYPAQLSGGEAQRVAIARAVVGAPQLVLADEPTGALDEQLSAVVCELLLDVARRGGAALVVATHDPLVARHMDRVLHLTDGVLVDR
jgi:putative ABC transport system ATP-binding protein